MKGQLIYKIWTPILKKYRIRKTREILYALYIL